MPPKPRQTIRPPSSSAPAPPSTLSVGRAVRRRRWVFSPPSIILLLLLRPICLLIGFVLLTEPCLNPVYTNSLWSKRGYFALLATPGAIPPAEWTDRFSRAGLRALFGVGVIQAWFTARLNAYIQKAQREHGRIVAALKMQRDKGEKTGVQRYTADDEEGSEGKGEVGSFVRQMESVSLTFLALPFVAAAVCTALGLLGAPLKVQTAVVAAHLTLLVALPLVHILGLPALEDSSTTTTTSPSTTTTSASTPTATTTPTTDAADASSTTLVQNAAQYWQALLTLKPNPTFLLPLYYPSIFCILGAVASSAVLALDWNVAYQTYPFPLLVGALLGLITGDLFTTGVLLFG